MMYLNPIESENSHFLLKAESITDGVID